MSRSATSVAKTATTATNSVIDDNVNDSTVQQVEESSHNTTNHALSPEQQRDPQKGEPEQQQQLWFREWELTWPIWHMLSRDDRRSLAHQHGYKTIGEFEEFMTLQRAVGDSTTTTSTVTEPYDNDLAYPSHYLNHQQVAAISNVANVKQKKTAGTNLKKTNHDDDDEEEDEEEYDHKQTPVLVRASSMASTTPSNTTASTAELSSEELLERAGQILMLPDELLHAIFRYLPVDAYGTLALVSPYWKHVTRTEAVYKRLCERLYLHQSQRKTLQVSRFGNSYRTMLEQRARVRAGGGVYVLKYCEVKKIQRDMWTEIPVGAVLESIYYRYLYFQEDGRVLYALTSLPPSDIFRRFYKMCLSPKSGAQHESHHHQHEHHHHHDDIAVWGTFSVKRNQVVVTAQQSWHTVQLHMSIPTPHRRRSSPHGRFGILALERHLSSKSGCFDEEISRDLVEYKVPVEVFRFVKDKRL